MKLNKFQDSGKAILAQTALHLEGIHLDLSDILNIINGKNKKVFNFKEEDAIILRNVIDALRYLDNIDLKNVGFNLNLYIKLNSILAKEQASCVDKLRDKPTSIACLDTEIIVYDCKDIEREIEKLNSIDKENFRQVVAEVFCKLARMQPFFDGNKRSTIFLCNIALMKKDLGLFFIDYKNLNDFALYLKDYYQGRNEIIYDFIGSKLIKEIEEEFIAKFIRN